MLLGKSQLNDGGSCAWVTGRHRRARSYAETQILLLSLSRSDFPSLEISSFYEAIVLVTEEQFACRKAQSAPTDSMTLNKVKYIYIQIPLSTRSRVLLEEKKPSHSDWSNPLDLIGFFSSKNRE